MRTRCVLAWTLIAAAAAAALPLPRSAGQEESSPPVTLRFLPRPGEPVVYRAHMDGEQTVNLGGKDAVTKYRTTTEFRLTFDERGTNGSQRAKLRYGRIHGFLRAAGSAPLEFDSAEAPPQDPEQAAAVAAFTAYAGREFALTFDESGGIEKVDGVRKVVLALAGRGPDADARRTFFARIVRRDAIEEQLGWHLLVTPLPPSALARGEGWQDSNGVPGLSGFRAVASLTHRMVSSASGVTKLASRGNLTVEATRPELRGGLVVKRATLEAQSRVSNADGLPLSVHSTLRMDLSLPTKKATIEQLTLFEVERTSAPPSASSSAQER